MTLHFISLTLALILSISDYVTEHIFPDRFRKNKKLVSFSAGVAVSYIILNLFPEIATFSAIDGKKLFFYALLEFVAINLIEQYAYKGLAMRKEIPKHHKMVHVAYFFAYNFLIGFVLVGFAASGLKKTLLFFIPFFLYIIAEILPQRFEFKTTISKVFFSMAPLFGAVIGISYTAFVESIFGEMIAFLTGVLLFIVIREFLPSDEAERPYYFLAGILFYAFIIWNTWSFI